MKTLINAVKRAALAIEIYCLEIQIYGQNECLACVNDPMLSGRILLARSETKRELARVRAAYNATLPVGQRKTWEIA
jgi:hypothetical protein